MMMISVGRERTVSAELEAAFGRLLPQLSPRLGAPGRERLLQLLAAPAAALFVARAENGGPVSEGAENGGPVSEGAENGGPVSEEAENGGMAGTTVSGPAAGAMATATGRIVGILTLVWYDVPSGRKAWIEDVVVDAAARGCGAGRALVDAALALACEIGAERVMLTSNPRRAAARALYRKCGFNEVETTVFAFKTNRK